MMNTDMINVNQYQKTHKGTQQEFITTEVSQVRSDSSSDEERERRRRRRDELYKPAREKSVKYVNNDLLELSEEERIRCDNTLPEPLLKTPVLPRNLPLTSTCRKENAGRNEGERYERSRKD